MTNLLKELSHWATTLPYWEQAAMDKLMAGVAFTDSDYDELLQYLLEDAGLAEPTGPRPTLRFPEDTDADSQPAAPMRLVKISNLQNVNALVSGQTLTFGPAMTAIFGANGSGKSGYARILGCAGFTRGDQEVLPDVTQPPNESDELSADIEVTGGTSNQVIHYRVGSKCPELGSFYVFDSTSVRVHLTGSNSLSFSPAGLSFLKQLAEVTDEVRGRLRSRIQECSQPHCFDALFQGDSEVCQLMPSLGPDTDLKALRRMATLTPAETEQIRKLDIQIARLKAQDVSEKMADLQQRVHDLEYLASRLADAQAGLDDQAGEEIRSALRTYLDRQAAAQRVGLDQFKSEHFTQIGSDAWYQLIEAARVLANAEGAPGELYPQPGNHCLLCQQSLSAEARDLLLRLWAFLDGGARRKLDEAQEFLEARASVLDAVDLDFFDDQSVAYRYLQEHDLLLLEKVKAFVTVCHERREVIGAALGAHAHEMALPALPEYGIADIENILASLKIERAELETQDPAEEINRLEQALRCLQHRVVLSQHFPAIEDYVRKRVWARRAERVGGSTRHITTKHNQLFQQLVTDRYIELFEQTLKDMGRPLRVKVETKGRKGEVYKQIVVEAARSGSTAGISPDKVLSEGEKRAVALADFLTEVSLDTSSSGIILDDPVTSLDLEWREVIASILTEQAKQRQVIVFTHDLPFLYYLKKHCERQEVEVQSHWIKRGDHDNGPGYVFLNNSPALERDYRSAKRAREFHTQAKSASAAQQEALLRDGFGALRTTYEAFIIFDLLNEVVMRFDERVSFGRLKDIVWDPSIAHEVITKCEILSRYIEGHLHSDAFAAQKPTPDLLLSEIEAFEGLRKKLRALKKAQ